jgi:DNA-binding transcriptional LysR family regulator
MGGIMTSSSHRLVLLRAEHARLHEEIRNEMARPLPDSLTLMALKQRKLRVKELIGWIATADVKRQGPWQDWHDGRTTDQYISIPYSMEREFDPATATRRFSVGAMYYANFTAVPRFVQMLKREAPGVDFRFYLHHDTSEAVQMLDDGRTELAMGALRDLPSRFRSQQVGLDYPVCIARRGHPALIDGLDLDTFLRLPHASASRGMEEVDEALAHRSRQRHIKLAVPAFYPLVCAVEYSDMLAVVPAAVARALALYVPITIHDIPFDVPHWPRLMAWTAAAEQDPGIRWLRDFFDRLYAALTPEPPELGPHQVSG